MLIDCVDAGCENILCLPVLGSSETKVSRTQIGYHFVNGGVYVPMIYDHMTPISVQEEFTSFKLPSTQSRFCSPHPEPFFFFFFNSSATPHPLFFPNPPPPLPHPPLPFPSFPVLAFFQLGEFSLGVGGGRKGNLGNGSFFFQADPRPGKALGARSSF